MAFWGAVLKEDQPYTLPFTGMKRRLCISRATLVDCSPSSSTEVGLVEFSASSSIVRNLVHIIVGNQTPVVLCSLSLEKNESCQLDVHFDEIEDVIFSTEGPGMVNLVGYYLRDSFGEETKIQFRETPMHNVRHNFVKDQLEALLSLIRQHTKGTTGNENQRNCQIIFFVDDLGTVHVGQVSRKLCGEMVTGSLKNSFFGQHTSFDGQQSGVIIVELDDHNASVEIPDEGVKKDQKILKEGLVKKSRTVGEGVGKKLKKKKKHATLLEKKTVEHEEIDKSEDLIIKAGKQISGEKDIVHDVVSEKMERRVKDGQMENKNPKCIAGVGGTIKKVTKKRKNIQPKKDEVDEVENAIYEDSKDDILIEPRTKGRNDKSACDSPTRVKDRKPERVVKEGNSTKKMNFRKKDGIKDDTRITYGEAPKSEALEGGVSRELKKLKKEKSNITDAVRDLLKPCNAFEMDLQGKLNKKMKKKD